MSGLLKIGAALCLFFAAVNLAGFVLTGDWSYFLVAILCGVVCAVAANEATP